MKTNWISFSGGETSGKMADKLINRYAATFDRHWGIAFENTGKEHDATIEFVHEFETQKGVEVIWLEYTRVPAIEIDPALVPEGRKRSNLLAAQAKGEDFHWYNQVNYETASRNKPCVITPYDKLLKWVNQLPNVANRMCSVQLKIRTRDRYLRSTGVREFNSYIGIRADEAWRKVDVLANLDQYENPNFPLLDEGVTKADVRAFWDTQPFKLNIPNHLGNCDICFLKARWKRLRIIKDNPGAVDWWIGWEDRFEKKCYGEGDRFRSGDSYSLQKSDANHPLLFEDEREDDSPCGCAIGGMRSAKDDDDL